MGGQPHPLGRRASEVSAKKKILDIQFNNNNNNNNNNNIWILFAMSAYSFDKPKFTSTREKRKEKKTISKKH